MRLLALLTLFLVCSYESFSQKSDKDYKKKYLLAYDYLKELTNIESKANLLKEACAAGGYPSTGFETELHISLREVPNDMNLVLCDYILKNYNVGKSCAELFGKNLPIVQHLRDSIAATASTEGYSPNEILRDYISDAEKGVIVFFSRIHHNTLSAEVMTFCDTYKKSRNWQGSSDIYYFQFSEEESIKNVYQGKKYYR